MVFISTFNGQMASTFLQELSPLRHSCNSSGEWRTPNVFQRQGTQCLMVTFRHGDKLRWGEIPWARASASTPSAITQQFPWRGWLPLTSGWSSDWLLKMGEQELSSVSQMIWDV